MSEPVTDKIGIIILAAGYSKRFCADKRQAILSTGLKLLDTTLQQIPDNFHQRLLVLHPGDEEFAGRYIPDWSICIAEDAALGMGHSLAAAMQQVKSCNAVLIGLGDMPYILTETYLSIRNALKDYPIVRPYWQGKAGNPVGFRIEFFEELAELHGDQGARKLLEQHAKEVYRLDCPDKGVIRDIDSKAELSTDSR
tara:strand:+ start:854 stop:1441 length:588 start_codon:yes stop_codon:yes gene_type:complete